MKFADAIGIYRFPGVVATSGGTPTPILQTLALVGDSRFKGQLVGSTYPYYNARAIPGWARAYSRGALATTPALNFATSGWRTDQILAALPGNITAMQAAGVTLCFVIGGTNDRNATNPATGALYTAAATLTNLAAIVTQLRAAGILVALLNDTPRNDLSGGLLTDHVSVRDGVNAMAGQAGLIVVDSWSQMQDPNNPQRALADMVLAADGVHPTVKGAQAVGQAMWNAVASRTLPRTFLPTTNAQGTGQNANLLTNALMTGSGTVADSWAVTNNAGGDSAVVNSLVDKDGKRWQQIVVSGTPSGSDAAPLFVRLEQSIDALAGEFLVGDVLDAMVEIQVDNPVGIRAVDLLIVGPNVSDLQADAGAATEGYRLGPNSFAVTLKLMPITVSAIFAQLRFRLRIVGANGVLWGGGVRATLPKLTRTNR